MHTDMDVPVLFYRDNPGTLAYGKCAGCGA